MAGVRDRVAVVTGAANGLGREIAQLLAQEGARVVLGNFESAGLERTVAAITAAGGTALAVVGDLTEEESASRLIDTCVDRFGRVELRAPAQPAPDFSLHPGGGAAHDAVLAMAGSFACPPAPEKTRRGTAYYQGGSAYSAA